MKKILFAMLMVVALFADEQFVLHTVKNKDIHITVTDSGIKVKEYPHKVIILDFFGKNCPPCQMMIPRMIATQKRFADKLQIIGLHVQEPLDMYDLQRFEKIGINYPVVDYLTNNDNKSFVIYMAQLVSWDGSIAFMLIFDSDGNYVMSHLGLASEQELADDVEMYYKGSETNTSVEGSTTKE